MFEGWISELLAGYLGHFLDVKREQLRVSLWNAWSSGLALEDVHLKMDAFDYLQLPVSVVRGSIRRLEVQVPWRALRSKPILVQLSGVDLTVSERSDSDWEAQSALKRASAAKVAQLAAFKLQQSTLSAGSEPQPAGTRKSKWALLSYISTFLLNKLNLRVTSVNISFQRACSIPGSPMQTLFTVCLDSLQSSEDREVPDISLSDNGIKGSALARVFQVQGLSLAWRTRSPCEVETPALDKRVHGMQLLLQPMSCALQLSSSTGDHTFKHGSQQLSASLLISRVQWSICRSQIYDAMQLLDDIHLWHLRNRVAVMRPATRQTGSSWRPAWRYAINAVLVQLGRKPWASGMPQTRFLQHRLQRYVHLYRLSQETGRLLAVNKLGPEDMQELLAIEADPWIPAADLIAIQARVNRSLKRASGGTEHGDTSRQGWLGWAVSGPASFLGYVPLRDAPGKPDFDDADLQTIADQLELGAASIMEDASTACTTAVHAELQIDSAEFLLIDDVAALRHPLLMVDVRLFAAGMDIAASAASATTTVQSFQIHDLSSSDHNVRKLLMDSCPADGISTGRPFLQLDWANFSETKGGSTCNVQAQQMHMHCRPACLQQLLSWPAGFKQSTQAARVAAATSQLTPAGQAAIAEQRSPETHAAMQIRIQVTAFTLTAEVWNGEQLTGVCLKLAGCEGSVCFPSTSDIQEHVSKIHVSVKQLRVVVTTRSADDPREHRTDVLAPLTLQLDAKLSSVIAGTIDLTTTKMVLACKTSTLDGLECIMHEHLCWLCLEQPARQPPPSMDSKLQAAFHSAIAVHIPEIAMRLQGPSAEADNTAVDLSFLAQAVQLTANVNDSAVSFNGLLQKLAFNDCSAYTSTAPRLRGRLPPLRLARNFSVSLLTAFGIFKPSLQELTVSVELAAAYANGFTGEKTNFIRRLQAGTHSRGLITFTHSRQRLQTSITLQDGCFGVGMLLRIAAIFQPDVQPDHQAQQDGQDTPVITASKSAPDDLPMASQQDQSEEQLFRTVLAFQLSDVGESGAAAGNAGDGYGAESQPDTEVLPDAYVGSASAHKAPPQAARQQAELQQAGFPRPRVKMKAARTKSPGLVPSTHFSLEVLHCVVIFPDVPDDGRAKSAVSVALELPQLLLQLPAHQPASHPSQHPVQALDQGHAAAAAMLHAVHTNVATAVLSMSQAVMQVGPMPRLRSPSRPDIHRVLVVPSASLANSHVNAGVKLALAIPSVQLSLDAEQLGVLHAAIKWSRLELSHLSGTVHQDSAPSWSPPQQQQQQQQCSSPSSRPHQPAAWELSIDHMSLTLHSIEADEPALLCLLDQLAVHADLASGPSQCSASLQQLKLCSSSPAPGSRSSYLDLLHGTDSPQAYSEPSLTVSMARAASAPAHASMSANLSAARPASVDIGDRSAFAMVAFQDSQQTAEKAVNTGLAEAAGFGSSPSEQPSMLMTSWRAAKAAKAGAKLQRVTSGSRASISSSGSSPVQPTHAALQAHDSSISDGSFQSAASGSLSTDSSQHWQAASQSQNSANLDWFDPPDYDTESAVSAASGLSSSHTSADSQKGTGVSIVLLQGTRSADAVRQDMQLTYHHAAVGADQHQLAVHDLLLRYHIEGTALLVKHAEQLLTCMSAAAGRSKPRLKRQQAQQGALPTVPVQLHASPIVMELIAAKTIGGMSSSPSAIIHASCSATLAVSPGLRRLELQALEFPSLLLSVAMVDEHSDGMQHVAQDVNAGALMGVSHVSLHSQRTARLELTAQVGQASMWASSNRLCIAAGFVMSAAGSIAGLLGEITHLNRKAALSHPAEADVSVHVRSAAILLSQDHGSSSIPILEAVLSKTALEAHYQDSVMRVALSARPHINSYSNEKLGWEPLVEPWSFAIDMDLNLSREPERGGRATSQRNTVQLSSASLLEITLTSSLPAAVALAEEVVRSILNIQQHPWQLQQQIMLSRDQRALRSLQNISGAALEFKDAAQASDASADSWTNVGVGNMAALPAMHGHAAGQAAGLPTDMLSTGAITLASAVLTEPSRAKAIVLRLHGQQGFSGPFSLTASTSKLLPVQVSVRRASGAAQPPMRVHLAVEVAPERHGGCSVLIHSGLQVINWTSLPLKLGLGAGAAHEPSLLQVIQPEEHLWLPCIRTEPGMLCMQPAGSDLDGADSYLWSPGIRLQPLIELAHKELQASGHIQSSERVARHVACRAILRSAASMRFHVGVIRNPQAAGLQIVIQAPLMLQNSLPMPITIHLKAPNNTRSVHLQPKTQTALHTVDYSDIIELVVQLLGYQWSSPIRVPKIDRARPLSDATSTHAMEASSPEEVAERSFTVYESAEGHGSATVYLRHLLDADCGSHLLRFSCALWVYNCTGFPVALQQSDADESVSADQATADTVPQQWVRPYEKSPMVNQLSTGMRSMSSGYAPSVAGFGTLSGTRAATPDHAQRSGSESRRFRLHHASVRREALMHGMAASIEARPSYTSPTSFPSMQGGVQPSKRRLRLQIRASAIRARAGSTFWSSPVALDALGGAAVVMVPCPASGTPAAMIDSPAAFMMAVTAAQVEDGDGALAVHLMPRFVLHNTLQTPLVYKQQGTSVEKNLAAGAARPLHWSNAKCPLRLCVRIQEAGWLWSGGMSISSPGDMFIKIRHRGRGETMMARVDVSTTAAGPMLVTFSHQVLGFAPYRLDNCSSETLHVSQHQCEEQEDVLRPYTSLDYAWDEPALQHRLNLFLPGNRKLGSFHLDRVGTHAVLTRPPNAQRGEGERKLQLLIRAEGPTRVLSVTDLQVHMPLPLTMSQDGGESGWQSWSNIRHAAFGLPDQIRGTHHRASAVADGTEASFDLAGICVSVVLDHQEMLYARMSGVQLRHTASKVRRTLELAVASLQVENPLRGAIHTEVLAAPAAQPRYRIGLTARETLPASIAAPQQMAVRIRAALWQRQPAGVLCVEKLELALSPFTLAVEHLYLLELYAAAEEALTTVKALQAPARRDEPDLLMGGYVTQQPQQRKVYIEHLYIARILANVSFLPASWAGLSGTERPTARGSRARIAGLQRFVAVIGEIEGGSIRLAPLEMHHPLLNRTALQQQIYAHYMRMAIPELVKLVGSANVLGDPVRLFHHLGLGVWSFLAYPAVGLVDSARGRGPWRIIAGVQEGCSSLIGNVVFAISNATAKGSAALRQQLEWLGLEKGEVSAARQRQPRLQENSTEAGLLAAIIRGIAGLVSEPARGADEGGILGFVVGTGRGLLGALIRPLDSVLDTAARIADSIRTAVMGPAHIAARIRPPRYVSSTAPLAAYDWSEAIGRYLLQDVEGGKYAYHPYVACVQLQPGTEFAVLTASHLLCIHSPGLHFLPSLMYAVALEDVTFLQRRGTGIFLLALPPSVTAVRTAGSLLRRHVLMAPVRLPFFSATLECQDRASADRILKESYLAHCKMRDCQAGGTVLQMHSVSSALSLAAVHPPAVYVASDGVQRRTGFLPGLIQQARHPN